MMREFRGALRDHYLRPRPISPVQRQYKHDDLSVVSSYRCIKCGSSPAVRPATRLGVDSDYWGLEVEGRPGVGRLLGLVPRSVALNQSSTSTLVDKLAKGWK